MPPKKQMCAVEKFSVGMTLGIALLVGLLVAVGMWFYLWYFSIALPHSIYYATLLGFVLGFANTLGIELMLLYKKYAYGLVVLIVTWVAAIGILYWLGL